MMSQIPTNFSDAFHEYAGLMVRLHLEMSHGDPDGPEADAIRDLMDPPWYAMSPEERELTGGLSEDLYSIGENPTSSGELSGDKASVVLQLLERRDFAIALIEIRRMQKDLPADFVAHCRGVCWAEWNEFGAAREFFDEALRLAPNSPLHQTMCLALALQTQAYEGVTDLAKRVVMSTNHVRPLCYAAIILGIQGSKLISSGTDGAQVFAQVVQGVDRARKLAQEDATGDDLKADLSTAMVWSAIAQDQLGASDLATAACDEALSIDPTSSIAKELRSKLSRDLSTSPGASKCDEPSKDRPPFSVSFADTAATMLTPA